MEYNENDVCCVDCGVKHLISIGGKPQGGAVTANKGICCICGEEKTVISIRHYNYLQPKQDRSLYDREKWNDIANGRD